jgi:hypothetical protein
MSEHADMMINGLLCQQCGVLIDGLEPGFPRNCNGCEEPDSPQKPPSKKAKKKAKDQEPKFPLGQVMVTAAINDVLSVEKAFEEFVNTSISRHHRGDWGDCCEEDKQLNDDALQNSTRIFSVYLLPEDLKWVFRDDKIWIITEADRSSTTVLLPSEY